MQNKENIKEKMSIFTKSKSEMVKESAEKAREILQNVLKNKNI